MLLVKLCLQGSQLRGRIILLRGCFRLLGRLGLGCLGSILRCVFRFFCFFLRHDQRSSCSVFSGSLGAGSSFFPNIRPSPSAK